MKVALEILYGEPCYHMWEVLKRKSDISFWCKVADNEPHDFQEVLSGYCCTLDFPASKYWWELQQCYPDAKVILTIRTSESWFNSCVETVFTGVPDSPYQTFGQRVLNWISPSHIWFGKWVMRLNNENFLNGDYSKKNCMSSFEKWNENVIKSCPANNLLVFRVSDGWEPLCEFLQLPVPDVPFPHENDTASFKKMLRQNNFLGTALFFGFAAITTVAVGMACLVQWPKEY